MAVQVVSFRCVLKDNLGRIISSTVNRNILTNQIGDQGTLAAIVEKLHDLRKGEKRRICLRAEQAYGYYNPKLVIVRRHDDLSVGGEPMRLGERVVYETNGRQGVFIVTGITNDSVTLDGNHPLAGQDLVFEIEATEAREATLEELDANLVQQQTPRFH